MESRFSNQNGSLVYLNLNILDINWGEHANIFNKIIDCMSRR